MCGWEVFFSFYKMTLLECSPSGGSVAAKCTNCCIADENSSLPYMRQLFWNAFLVDEMPGRCKLFNLSHCITRRGDLEPYNPASWDASFWWYGITKSWHFGLCRYVDHVLVSIMSRTPSGEICNYAKKVKGPWVRRLESFNLFPLE